jgi:hypothetical protein
MVMFGVVEFLFLLQNVQLRHSVPGQDANALLEDTSSAVDAISPGKPLQLLSSSVTMCMRH